jgi:hypothetical protein
MKSKTIANKKAYLKELASEIREKKLASKSCQRELQAKNLYASECWYEAQQVQKTYGIRYDYDYRELSRDYRHHHIAYCLIRGRQYEQIEKPAPDNLPDMTLINSIVNEMRIALDEEAKNEQAIRSDSV